MPDVEVLERLDRLIGLYELVNQDSLALARETALADDVTRHVILIAQDWTPASELYSKAAAAANTSERTVQRRVPELTAKHALQSKREGTAVLFKSTGLYA